MNPLDLAVPSEEQLLQELKKLRQGGITGLSGQATPELDQAVLALGRAELDENVEAYMVEALLREVVAELGGDRSELAAILFGLQADARADRPSELRKQAAETAGVSGDHFRKAYEPRILGQMVQIILRDIHTYRLRLARIREEVRTPVGSRLAVEWLGRFEAMYRIWTQVSGLANDLTAARSTMLEQDRPWDGVPDVDAAPDDEPYTQELQAAGYVTFAWYHGTRLLHERQRWMNEHGGLWILPDAQAENDLADALSKVVWAMPNNERDDSYLRSLLARTEDLEMDSFLRAAAKDEIAMSIHWDWQAFAQSCECTWSHGDRVGRENWPIPANRPGIDAQCDVHLLIAAANDYCLILDDAWDQMADWYRDVPFPRRVDITSEEVMSLRDSSVGRWLRS